MQIVESNADLRTILGKARTAGRSIGFVPTMGYLHEGHLSLMRHARQENDLVVVSVFVNPTQFGPNEDLDAYPRNARRDKEFMRSEKVDIAFFPRVEDIYPGGFATYVTVECPMTEVLCARSRPNHFRGVTTIVTKLFHLVAPHKAYFGQKDAQQVAVIQQMVRDLNFDIEVVVCPIVREADGLAMSSRNTYLSNRHRADAAVLYQSLIEAERMVQGGERSAASLIRFITLKIRAVEDAQIDYVSVVNARTLADLKTLEGEVLVALAVKFGKTRLIDNIRIRI